MTVRDLVNVTTAYVVINDIPPEGTHLDEVEVFHGPAENIPLDSELAGAEVAELYIATRQMDYGDFEDVLYVDV